VAQHLGTNNGNYLRNSGIAWGIFVPKARTAGELCGEFFQGTPAAAARMEADRKQQRKELHRIAAERAALIA
jgi:hypothetical protein